MSAIGLCASRIACLSVGQSKSTSLKSSFLGCKLSGVEDCIIMHYAYGELGELEEEMRRSFHGHFKKDINVKSEIGVMLPSSFDGKDSDELTIEQIVHGPPEYSQWESRN